MKLRQSLGRWADRLTELLHFDVKFYGKSFTWMSFGQASGVVRGVATTFIMARWLPRDTMGEFRYILALFGVAGIFSLSGAGAGVIRGIAKGDTAVARAALKQIAIISPLGTVLLLLGALERWHAGDAPVAAGLVVAAFMFPFSSLFGLYGSILTGKDEIKRLVKIAIVNNLTYAACFFLVIWRTKELLPIVIAYFGFDIAFRGFITWMELRRLPNKGNAGEHLRLGAHLSAIGVFQTIAAQLDQILLQRFFGYGTLANYSIAMLIPEQIKDFINAMGGIVLRRFSRHEESKKNLRQTQRHFWTMMGVAGSFVVGYAVVAPFAIPWLFPQYRDQAIPSIVYAIGLLGMAAIIGLNYMQAHNQIKKIWTFYVANTVLSVAADIALIPFFGSWGAILSQTGVRLVSTVFSYPMSAQPQSGGTLPPSVPPLETSPTP